MAYRLKGAYAADRHVVLNVNELLDQMTDVELQRYVESGDWPERFGNQVRALVDRRQLLNGTPQVPNGESE